MTENASDPTPLQTISMAEMGGCPEADLHGMDAIGAEAAVEGFLSRAYRQGDPVVKIIHGKGTGKLQDTVRSVLRDHPLVVASSGSSRLEEMGAVIYAVIRPAV